MYPIDFLPDHMQPQLGKIFADELQKYEWSADLRALCHRLRSTDEIIYEACDGSSIFMETLWDICFPTWSGAILSHFTTLENAADILQQRQIWLHPVRNRMGEGELTDFASQLGYQGLQTVQAQGHPYAYELANDLFYLSLTDAHDLWDYGEVRLRLQISPILKRSELRRMGYAVGESHPLKVLNKLAQDHFGRHFMPWGVSRRAAFHLDQYHSWESEVRLLIKRHVGQSLSLEMRMTDEYEVAVVPLESANDYVRIELMSIETDTRESLKEVKAIVAQSSFSDVPILLGA